MFADVVNFSTVSYSDRCFATFSSIISWDNNYSYLAESQVYKQYKLVLN